MPVWRGSPRETGSLGAGLLLEPPAVAEVYECPGGECGLRVRACGELVSASTSIVKHVVELLGGLNVDVSLESPAPLAVGYAVSAAIALAIAIGEGSRRGWSVEASAAVAHEAEVLAGTGLGDVVAMVYGRGLELRLAPGAPGLARVESFPVNAKTIYSLELGRMATTEMHRALGEKLVALAAPRWQRIAENPNLDTFLREAREFSVEAGFAPDWLREKLDRLVSRGLVRGWYVKKRVAIVVPEDDAAGEAREELEALAAKRGLRLRRHRPAGSPLSVEPCYSSFM
ncbi:pantoate kinase [Hyperthermus butylicus]|uniref:pantoate kinase n=1 Tax=Hyperthermus butylicus TaxID=54248 RepID=UPI00129A4432|nr:hypothetical protein [Hyperthermus butylicus]